MVQRHETFFKSIVPHVPIEGARVLEIGCGDGARSTALAKTCRHLTGIDPDVEKILLAKRRLINNADFQVGAAEALSFRPGAFGVAVFTLSLHHVAIDQMGEALTRAATVCSDDGRLVIIEPARTGSFYETEVEFGACDDDEQDAKKAALEAVTAHPCVEIELQLAAETIFRFKSVQEFVRTMTPKRNMAGLTPFLEGHRNSSGEIVLHAPRTILICRPIK